jgi:lipoic acid synthetase
VSQASRFAPKPSWLKVRAPGGETYGKLKQTFRNLDLHTVCEEARCPNVGECWSEGTATVMLLGDVCTRGCRFCAVTTGDPRGAVDVREPEHVARAIAKLGLQYVVLTMVDRDDLLDGGASHVAKTVQRLRELRPDLLVETLLGDFGGNLDYVDVTLETSSAPHVWAHNVETIRRLQRTVRDVRCGYDKSLSVLRRAKEKNPEILTKSSIMVGVGETDEEVLEAMADLRAAGVDLVTLGQYLRPTPKHLAVERFVEPKSFEMFAEEGKKLGFSYVASGPLVRSSYKAAEVFVRGVLRPDDPAAADALLKERLIEAQAAAERHGGAPRTTAELAARTASDLLPVSSLVRR